MIIYAEFDNGIQVTCLARLMDYWERTTWLGLIMRIIILTIDIFVKYHLGTLVVKNIQNMVIGKNKDEAFYFIQRIERMALVPVIRWGSREAVIGIQDNLGEALRVIVVNAECFS